MTGSLRAKAAANVKHDLVNPDWCGLWVYETVAVVMPEIIGKNLATYVEECYCCITFCSPYTCTRRQWCHCTIQIHACSPLATHTPSQLWKCYPAHPRNRWLDQLNKDSSHPLFDPLFEEWKHVVHDRVTVALASIVELLMTMMILTLGN